MRGLMTRDQFREAVFARDGHLCVVCQAEAQDAHHVMERRLFDDSGYYLDNGASLCGDHHIEAEQTTLSCEKIRELAGIQKIVLPEHLYADQKYDKWANPILPNGLRTVGELMQDESVVKILTQGGVMGQFTWRVKYPRTFHLPWSPGTTKDDRVLESDSAFEHEEIVQTLKMDGENTSLYSDYMHARSLDFQSQEDRDWVKAVWGRISHDIPEKWRVCGENLYAKHAILYQDLPSYFMMFSLWNDQNQCMSWNDTVEWATLMGLQTVPVIYRGEYSRQAVDDAFKPYRDTHEGYVIRRAGAFPYRNFRRFVGKYVRANHVVEHGLHWRRRMIERNGLAIGVAP